ncbi:beta-N-acetylglucosaminidase [Mucilaginibacter sp. PPCGB 2223]|uniref:serine hydrolase domain-containing protein n=1 Tax=Mucilaginibacter sp. PPCGB 2223 TaxID=1886027 RepID=UPI0008259D65|nr:serine hydrolase [Mucilaginibacter sp. PPCGB 2223]OCX52376.1 beta-N-acetylglucosaminidase [Mucilaginibacter sp. PPCGB 2223]
MNKNKVNGVFCALMLVLSMMNMACAQNPHMLNMAILNEEKSLEKSTVLLNNQQQLVPLQNLDQVQIASIHFTCPQAAVFDSIANKYAKVQSFNGNEYMGVKDLNDLAQDLKLYNTLIIEVTEAELANKPLVDFINSNKSLKNVVIVLFGTGKPFAGADAITAPIVYTLTQTPVSASYTAQVVFGGIAVTQKLTKNLSPKYTAGTGFPTIKTRLQYTVPENAGINSGNLMAIDDIARETISEHAAPGCVVLVARNGKVIFNKAYGFHTYDKTMPDKLTDIFDLASMTKVSATTMEAMKLTGEGKLNLDSTLGYYIPKTRNTNKADIKVREILTHQAGLIPDIPTYTKVKPATDYNADSSAAFPTRLTDNLFLRKDYYKNVMIPDMMNSPLKTRGKYVYSDLSMILMAEVEESITATPLNVYVQNQFYKPLGMQTAGFLPLYRFKKDQIIPTENDEEYRHALLIGYVHDPTSSLMGGVAGHAGLFASANDVAILYQMVLNGGTYGGVQYLKPEVVADFTRRQSDISRRALGFDMWDPNTTLHYPSELAPPDTYGHTGYTGTCIWVDPSNQLVYIFLSNRVNPKVSDKLSQLKIRGRIQDAIYKAISAGM